MASAFNARAVLRTAIHRVRSDGRRVLAVLLRRSIQPRDSQVAESRRLPDAGGIRGEIVAIVQPPAGLEATAAEASST